MDRRPTETDLDRPDRTLELDGAAFRELVSVALDHLAAHLDSLPQQPSWNIDHAADVARSVIEPMPDESKTTAPELMHRLFHELVPVSYNTAGPGYLAYVPGGGVPHAAVADLISGIVNRYVGVWTAAPALAQIEATVVRWFCDLMSLPAESGGFLTTGGSLANWTALVTARCCRLGDTFADGVLYASVETHHSVRKAAILAGLSPANVRSVDTDPCQQIKLRDLAAMVQNDRRDGLRPFAVIANAGTTNTGAVDDLAALVDLARDESLWLHVDATYGGFFMLTERGRRLLAGIERADSISLDPHKGLFMPYGSGCLLVRRLDDLRRTHSAAADYMPAMQDDPDFVDFCEVSPELSRGFRGLRLWLPIQLLGIGAFRRNLDEKLDLAAWAADQLTSIETRPGDRVEIVAEPQLTTVAFRLVREGLDARQLAALNEDLRQRINGRRRVMLTPTTLGDRYVIRICVLSFRTHLERMRQCLEDIQAEINTA